MDGKPLILNDNISLVNKDLSNVYRNWIENGDNQCQFDVKFKKKEDVNGLSKSLLKHRILTLTGKNLVNIESEMGKSLDTVEELRKFSKVLLHEAFGKLPIAMETSTTASRKRTLDDANGKTKLIDFSNFSNYDQSH